MARNIKYALAAALFTLMTFFVPVFADVAPDPIVRTVSYLPVILVAAVVIVALFLIRKFFGKK